MGKIMTAYELRLKRARILAVCPNGGPGHFDVQSQSNPNLKYHVQLALDTDDTVKLTHCECPDWQTMNLALNEWIETTHRLPHPGISHVNYSPACKHVLGALLHLGAI